MKIKWLVGIVYYVIHPHIIQNIKQCTSCDLGLGNWFFPFINIFILYVNM